MRSNIKAWMERARLGIAKALKYLTKQKRKQSDSWTFFSLIWIDPTKEEVASISRRLRRWHIVVAALLILALVMWVYRTEIWAYLSPAGWGIEENFGDKNQITNLRNLALILLGVIGLPLAIWRSTVAQQQIFVVQKGQYADRFAKAAAMLADDSLPVREAGIFALRELAIADPKGHYFPVQDLLCSFMRDAARQAEEREKEIEPSTLTLVPNHKPDADDPAPCTSDVIAALRAFSDLRTHKNKRRERDRDWEPDLQRVRLTEFPGHSRAIDLSNATLFAAQFKNAKLADAQFQNAILAEAQLKGAILIGAELQDANLEETGLQGAVLIEARLQGASLQGTDLQGAELQYADLEETLLIETNLKDAGLEWTNFREALLQDVNLQEAALKGAEFSPPVWPRSEWPKGWVPSKVKVAEPILDKPYEYFTFIQVDEKDET